MNRDVGDNLVLEDELVRRAQAGDADAFAALVARYQDRIYNTCYRMCRNDADALDLTQTAFLKALQALPRFDARARFYTWLYRIAVNLTMTLLRQRRRRRTGSLDGGPRDEAKLERAAPSEATAVEGALEAAERRARVELALSALDEEFRIAVVLKDVEDMDYATIGEILGVPIGTVKSRIYRGRMMLRERLAPERIGVDSA